MTYCVAWTYGNNAYIVADTLRTQEVPAAGKRTSVNEPQKQVGRYFVEESLLKIIPIRDGVALAIAGDVACAFEIVDFISEHFDMYPTPRQVFQAMTISLGPFSSDRRVALLLASAGKAGDSAVSRWDSATCVLEEGADAYDIGSLTMSLQHKNLTEYLINQVRGKSRESGSVLIAAIAILQSYGIHDDLISKGFGVGGIVCGLRVCEGHTYWQEDWATVIYDSAKNFACPISAHVRDDILVVNSENLGSTGSIFTNKGQDKDELALRTWYEKWFPSFGQYLFKHAAQCRTWVFLSREMRVATVVHALHEIADAAEQFSVQCENGQCSMELTPTFWSLLQRRFTKGPEIGIDLGVFVVDRRVR